MSGVVISIVPIFDVSGQCAASALFKPISSGEQPTRLSAADGDTDTPGGNATTCFFIVELERPSGDTFCGTCSSTHSPLGESAIWCSGCTVNFGSNERCSQPVVAGIVESVALAYSPDSLHESIWSFAVNGPAHVLGFTKNGSGNAASPHGAA